MDADAIFARCAERRRALADLLDTLDDAQLATPSLCAGWDVRTVAGHLVVPFAVPLPQFGLAVARRFGSFHRANDDLARATARRPVPELAAVLREHADSRFTPPMHGPMAPLVDLVAHTSDIRFPLGLPLDVRPDEAAAAFDFLTGFALYFLPRGRLRGIELAPDDLDRSWGSGAPLTGPAADVLMAVLGRRPFIDRISGPGRDLLAQRA